MFNKTQVTRISIALSVLILLAVPRASFADRRDYRGDRWGGRHESRHYYRYHDHPRFGFRLSYVPYGSISVWTGGARYYYYDGLYYNGYGSDYVVVAPPVGAVVNVIPSVYQPVRINGMTYYADSGIYYVRTGYGYRVVPAPVMVAQTVSPAPTVVYQGAPQEKLGISDVMVLSRAGISDDVIIEKIANSGSRYNLSLEEVETLRKDGVSSRVVNFMLKR